MKKHVLSASFLLFTSLSFAQIKVTSGYINIGDIDNLYPASYYTTIQGGLYVTNKDYPSRFFQFDIWNGRIATRDNWCVFYNTQTSTFNDLAVGTVYNYSDALAKTNIAPIKYGLSTINKLKPVNYNFIKDPTGRTDKLELGLLAQEVELLMPELVRVDSEGNKLLNYTGLIPVLIKSIQELQLEIAELKRLQLK